MVQYLSEFSIPMFAKSNRVVFDSAPESTLDYCVSNIRVSRVCAHLRVNELRTCRKDLRLRSIVRVFIGHRRSSIVTHGSSLAATFRRIPLSFSLALDATAQDRFCPVTFTFSHLAYSTCAYTYVYICTYA